MRKKSYTLVTLPQKSEIQNITKMNITLTSYYKYFFVEIIEYIYIHFSKLPKKL